jgi:probable FeS assembly SUF system protein SufT
VTITQSLDGAYTVMTEHGDIVGIARQDADALGQEGAVTAPPRAVGPVRGPTDIEHLVWAQLKTCLDPEIPFNIVDLGLVYGCHLIPLPQGGYKVEVAFTLTSPTCGMGEWLKADIASKLLSVPGVTEVNVQIVFEPPWDQSRMSEEAKRELGLI